MVDVAKVATTATASAKSPRPAPLGVLRNTFLHIVGLLGCLVQSLPDKRVLTTLSRRLRLLARALRYWPPTATSSAWPRRGGRFAPRPSTTPTAKAARSSSPS